MSYIIAKENLDRLAKELNIPPPTLEESTCTLKLSEEISLHFTYEDSVDLLFFYTVLLPNPPQELKTALFEELLSVQLLFTNLTTARIALEREQNLLILIDTLPMHDAKETDLTDKIPSFIQITKALKEIIQVNLLKKDGK